MITVTVDGRTLPPVKARTRTLSEIATEAALSCGVRSFVVFLDGVKVLNHEGWKIVLSGNHAVKIVSGRAR